MILETTLAIIGKGEKDSVLLSFISPSLDYFIKYGFMNHNSFV